MDAPQLKCMAGADLTDTHVLCWLVIYVLSVGCVCVQFISDLLLSSKLIGCDYWPFPISDPILIRWSIYPVSSSG